jgi:hypothetical protein
VTGKFGRLNIPAAWIGGHFAFPYVDAAYRVELISAKPARRRDFQAEVRFAAIKSPREVIAGGMRTLVAIVPCGSYFRLRKLLFEQQNFLGFSELENDDLPLPSTSNACIFSTVH